MVTEIASNPQVNLSVQSFDGLMSVAGRAEVDASRERTASLMSAHATP